MEAWSATYVGAPFLYGGSFGYGDIGFSAVTPMHAAGEQFMMQVIEGELAGLGGAVPTRRTRWTPRPTTPVGPGWGPLPVSLARRNDHRRIVGQVPPTPGLGGRCRAATQTKEHAVGKEIERKYLVNLDTWKPQGAGIHFRQGYLDAQKERVVRVRIEGDQAKLTIKGISTGMTRFEFEYGIPVEDAVLLLDNLCEQPLIDKHRHKETHGGKTWEIDVFHGDNEGLVVAEIELRTEDEKFTIPAWARKEVSSEPRYYNSNLLKNPFKTWPKA
jgi:adenylate cyclase